MRPALLITAAILALACTPRPQEVAAVAVSVVTSGRQQTLSHQQRLEDERRHVLRILSKPDWYRPFLEILRKGLHKQSLVAGEMPTLAEPDGAPAELRRRWRRAANPPPAAAAACDAPVELVAAVRVAGRLCLNATRWLRPAPVADIDGTGAILRADTCDVELLLSARFVQAAQRPIDWASPRTTVATADSSVTPPPGPSVSGGGGRGGGRGGGYSMVRTQCTEEGYCLFGGTCVSYAIIDMQLCSCRPGFGGVRCEKFNLPTVMATLDAGRLRGVIGNGPIKGEEHSDILSVVESTARLLTV